MQSTVSVNAVMTYSANTGGGSGPSAPDSTSTSLLQRVKAQDPEAWGRLTQIYQAKSRVLGRLRQELTGLEDG